MTEKKKDVVFLTCQTAVAILGLLFMIIKGRFALIWMYLLVMAAIIPSTYFNYSLCKFENKWHSRWNEKKPCDGEPSLFRLRMGKLSEWACYILALSMVFLPLQ